MLGEHQDRQAGDLGAGRDRRLQALVGEGRRQPHVDDGDVRPVLEQGRQQRRAVVDGLDDLEVERLQQPGQSVPEEGEVFGEDNTHGSSMVTTVGPPGGVDRRHRAVERGQPALDAAQAGAAGRVGAAAAVVADRHGEQVVGVPQVDPGGPGAAVPDHVGQRLGDREVGGRLDRGLQAAGQVESTSTGIGRLSARARTAPSSPRSASTGGWMPRTRWRSSTRAVALASRASASSLRAAAGSRLDQLLGQADGHAQRDQPGLGAVVQVALDAAQLGGLRVDRVGPGDGQLGDPQAQLGGRGSGRGRAWRTARRPGAARARRPGRWPGSARPAAGRGRPRRRSAIGQNTP